jgi:hypothetical protein
VQYVGGRDYEDEWVPVPSKPHRVQFPPMLEKVLSQLEHAQAQEVQPLLAVCSLSPTVAGVLLASARELLKCTALLDCWASSCRGGLRERRGPESPEAEERQREGKIESRVADATVTSLMETAAHALRIVLSRCCSGHFLLKHLLCHLDGLFPPELFATVVPPRISPVRSQLVPCDPEVVPIQMRMVYCEGRRLSLRPCPHEFVLSESHGAGFHLIYSVRGRMYDRDTKGVFPLRPFVLDEEA